VSAGTSGEIFHTTVGKAGEGIDYYWSSVVQLPQQRRTYFYVTMGAALHAVTYLRVLETNSALERFAQ